jgi:hypothetical protein
LGAFALRLWFLAFGLLVWEALEGKIAGGRLMKGENELKGKELLKENCQRGIGSKSEGQDFKKAKERAWDSASLH